ncbi:MAG: bifunctional 4-hydroxy-2-oxoglutarate aldolase/2-dehydro-3-deoxy-phosphogluconate aldolase [Eubacteriales bacterium]
MDQVLKKLEAAGVVPVIKIEDASDALPLAKALSDGGLPVAEVTFRTSAASDAIRAIREGLPDMLVGAGTVLSIEQAKAAAQAGAGFVVSPGFNPRVVSWCLENGMPVVPGCSTPSDIEGALELGLSCVKFFPAESAGGLPMLKALSAPYSAVRFMPTGGIDEKNLAAYLSFDKVVACGGTFMVKEEFIKSKDWGKITALTKGAVLLSLGFRLAHIGINCEDSQSALKGAAVISSMLGWSIKDGNSSAFVGEGFEFMKGNGRGEKGHIAIGTLSCERALSYFSRMGIEADEASFKYRPDGKLAAAYFKDELCGFALHVVRG